HSAKHLLSQKVTVGVYMGKRDFVDHCEFVDPVGELIYVMLSCMFRYGRDDMDVLGMAFRRDIFLCSRQVYPPLQDKERSIHTKVQDKILRKLGDNAYPFFFEVRVIQDNLSCTSIEVYPTIVYLDLKRVHLICRNAFWDLKITHYLRFWLK
uniref:S-arrestin n=1 Tax=Sinocyclocheilus rhinocerous TaxID=307959 RepID=A0A673MBY3_9TELE